MNRPKEKTKIVNIPAIAIFDEETNEPICARWFGENQVVCKFLLFRKFGIQPVCGFSEQLDLNEITSRGFVKPKSNCPIHYDQHRISTSR